MARQPEPVQRSRTRGHGLRVLHQRTALADQRGVAQNLTDVGARHDHPLVHVEAVTVHIGAVQEIGRGFARDDTVADQRREMLAFCLREFLVAMWPEVTDRQVQPFEHDEGGLVAGAGRAVAIGEFRIFEFAGREAEEVTGCLQLSGNRNRVERPVGRAQFFSSLKPADQCEPSQKGLFFDAPQRQSV